MSQFICEHCGKESENLSAAGAGLYCEHCGEPSKKGREAGIKSELPDQLIAAINDKRNDKEFIERLNTLVNTDIDVLHKLGSDRMPVDFRAIQRTEHEAWGAVVMELRKRGVDNINEGGKDESLHDAITAWAEELVQLRLNDPDPSNIDKQRHKRREKYLGSE